ARGARSASAARTTRASRAARHAAARTARRSLAAHVPLSLDGSDGARHPRHEVTSGYFVGMGGAGTRPGRQRVPRKEREQLMLDAAEHEFGRAGLAAASMEEIARAS